VERADLGTASVAASLAGMILADAGARVVKVEPPGGGRLRAESPAGFRVWNRGKESLAADLRTDEGRAAAREAALHADVLLAGVPAGRLERWGLGEDQLRTDNPRLVHCQITGFGPTGPYARLKAYEGVRATAPSPAATASCWTSG
jgi:crotonobetainyl-CoA:carnitine CoA-transferase CaiB-like acyl-CoA transferase